jgi:integrase
VRNERHLPPELPPCTLESSSVTSALKVALDRAGLPSIRDHDLRHTCATILLEAGVHPKLVQDLPGHGTVALTLNSYSHVTSGLSREVARTIDRVFGAADMEQPAGIAV